MDLQWNDAKGAMEVGFCLKHGLGVERDTSKCFRCYKMSADQEYGEAAGRCALDLHMTLFWSRRHRSFAKTRIDVVAG
jgi:hypothetical protein